MEKTPRKATLERMKGLPENGPKRTDLQKAIDAAQASPPTPTGVNMPSPETAQSSAELPHTETPGPTTEDISLHTGMSKVAEKGALALQLAERIRTMQEAIDTRIVSMFTIMDKGVERALNGDAYTYDVQTDSIRAVENANYGEQLRATMRTAGAFADIVENIPNEIVALMSELDNAEKGFGSILLRQPLSPPQAPQKVEPWRSTMHFDQSREPIVPVSPSVPNAPRFEHGARETERVFQVASELADAIQSLKRRVDAQTIQILHTINEAATRALNGEAYTDESGTIAPTMHDPSIENRLQTIVRVASDLVVIMERLPHEIKLLTNEIQDAERNFYKVLRTNK